jgi:hypothetical protein
MNTKDTAWHASEFYYEIMATGTKLIFHWQNMPGGSFSLILTHDTGVLDTQDPGLTS